MLSKLARLAHCIRALQRTEPLEIYHLSVFHPSVYRLSRIYLYYKELAQVITESEKSQDLQWASWRHGRADAWS